MYEDVTITLFIQLSWDKSSSAQTTEHRSLPTRVWTGSTAIFSIFHVWFVGRGLSNHQTIGAVLFDSYFSTKKSSWTTLFNSPKNHWKESHMASSVRVTQNPLVNHHFPICSYMFQRVLYSLMAICWAPSPIFIFQRSSGGVGQSPMQKRHRPTSQWFNRWVCPWCIPSGYVKIAIENGHRNSGFSHQKWWFSIVMLVYQRVPPLFSWRKWYIDKAPHGYGKIFMALSEGDFPERTGVNQQVPSEWPVFVSDAFGYHNFCPEMVYLLLGITVIILLAAKDGMV